MRKYPILVMMSVMFLVVMAIGVFSFSGLGTGNSTDPFQITNCSQLQETNNNLTAYYLVMNNVNCSGVGWTPISIFSGNFDGQNYNISNIFYNSTGSAKGFFGQTNNAVISNVNIIESYIQGGSQTGGLVGYLQNTHLINCSYSGVVRGTNRVGGLVGEAYTGTNITNSYTQGAVAGTGQEGGLIGYEAGTGGSISNSFSHSDVNCSSQCGGAIGYVQNPLFHTNVYSKGLVKCSGINCNLTTGGFIGVVGCGSGDNPNYINLFFDNQTSGHNRSVGTSYSCERATGKNTSDMQTQATFTNWNFTTIWEMCPSGYPHLKGFGGCPPPPCVPNWTCSGYADCLQNNTQVCNNVTDLNTCGQNYTGNFSEFTPQVCEYCWENWTCSQYGNCLPNNVQPCQNVTDLNVCNRSYTGNLSDFDLTCNTPLCYQESANVSTECGGLDTGSYWASTGGNPWEGTDCPNSIYDGNWDTYCQATAFSAFLSINYTKPIHSVGVTWNVRIGNQAFYNFTIPQACWDAFSDRVWFDVDMDLNPSVMYLYCHNNTQVRTQLFSGGSSGPFWSSLFEESVYWNISCNSSWLCVDYGQCLPDNTEPCNDTIDQEGCGQPYTGNYSEFEPLVCDFCTPNWNCSLFGDCVNSTKVCLSVSDLNTCNETFEDNLSDFDQSCQAEPNYVPTYKVGDLPNLFVDLFGSTFGAIIGIISLFILGLIIYLISRHWR